MSETTSGRQPVQIIELDQDFCNLTYGTSPCTAAIGVTGSDRCFNTRATCQDSPNYDRGSKTLRFVKPLTYIPADEYMIPSLVSVSTSPTIINIANGSNDQKPLGVRATLTATFMDFPHSDRVVDKYRTQRSYDPLDKSTFWAKWLARNPYYQNRTIRVLDGYIGQALGDMVSRTYLIDSISGPDANGRVTLKAKDVLALADDKKAQFPLPSTGELIVDIDETVSTIRVTGADASDYLVPGIIRIGDELIPYTGISTISGTEINFTGCTRGALNTDASSHESKDRVQRCADFQEANCVDIANELLLVGAGIDPSYIDYTEWYEERDQWLPQFNMSTILSEPTGVTELLGELTEQCLFYIWWDERIQKIRLRAVRPVTETPGKFNDEQNIIAGSSVITQAPKERLSQVWIFWNRINQTESLDEEGNYRRVQINADLDKESDNQYGEQVIRKIYSRWIINDGQAINLGTRMLARYSDNPVYFTCSVDAKDRSNWTGDIIDVTHRNIVDSFGDEIETRYQIISAEEVDSGHLTKYKMIKFEFAGRFAFIMVETAPDFTSATEEEKASGCWIADDDGLMSDGSAGYIIQ